MILSPVTLAVMKPIVAAASAMVDICPIEITDDMMILCSNICVLATLTSVEMYGEKQKLNIQTLVQAVHI